MSSNNRKRPFVIQDSDPEDGDGEYRVKTDPEAVVVKKEKVVKREPSVKREASVKRELDVKREPSEKLKVKKEEQLDVKREPSEKLKVKKEEPQDEDEMHTEEPYKEERPASEPASASSSSAVLNKNSEGETFFELGPKKRLTVRPWKNMILIDIREYYQDKSGESKPGKKGISLTSEQFQAVMDFGPEIAQAIRSARQ